MVQMAFWLGEGQTLASVSGVWLRQMGRKVRPPQEDLLPLEGRLTVPEEEGIFQEVQKDSGGHNSETERKGLTEGHDKKSVSYILPVLDIFNLAMQK